MTIADLLLIVGAVSGITSIIIQARRDRNRPAVDQSEASKNFAETISILNKQLADNGKTFKDLLDDMAEIPQLRSQLRETKDEMVLLKKQFMIMVSFGREHWAGSKLLHKQVIDKLPNETPAFVPAERFITGPLIDRVAQ